MASNLPGDKPEFSGPESMELDYRRPSVDTPLSEDLPFYELYKTILEDPINRDLVHQIDTDPTYIETMQNLNLIFKEMHKDRPPQFDIEAYNSAFKRVCDNPELVAKFKQLAVAMEQVRSMSGERITHANGSPADDFSFNRSKLNVWFSSTGLIKTTWFEACKRSYESAVGYAVGLQYKLVDGVDINQVNKYGKTALHSACVKGKVKLAKFLIENGADVDALDLKGNAPLHYAAVVGSEQCVELLLKHEADVTLINSGGKTPYGLAELENHNDIMKLLLQKDVEKLGLEKNI